MARGRPANIATEVLERYSDKSAGTDACWLWTGCKAGPPPNHYGVVRINMKMHRAHVLAYQTFVGPIEKGWIVRHKCHNPPCVNPKHLIVGTNQDNSDDMTKASRSAKTYSWVKVQAIRADFAAGLSMSRIADRFGVSSTLVHLYVKKIIRKYS